MQGSSGRAERAKVIAAFIAIYIVWGSTFMGIKIAVETIPPLTAAGVRFLIAGAIVYSWARLRGAPRPSRSEWVSIAMIGSLMFLPPYAALYWAERSVPSGMSAVLVATLPLWTVLLEAGVSRRRRVTPVLVFALGTGFAGVILLAAGSGGAGQRAIPWLPCVAVVFAEISWAVGSVLTPRVRLPKSSAATAGGEMIVGGALLVLCATATGEWHALSKPTTPSVLAMAYVIVAGSIIAFSAYVWLLGRVSATRLSSFTYVNPVVALVIGFQFGGERLSPIALFGSLLVVASVVLVQWAGRGAVGNAGQNGDKHGLAAAALRPREAAQTAGY
jgi:drug/metabolite transporter (DMT)-like permease